MKARLQRVELPEHGRIVIISDVHGHAEWLDRLLTKIGFDGEDVLFLLGDLIDKGPDSLGTVERVMALCGSREVYPLLGNWEAYRLSLIEDDEREEDLYDCERELISQFGTAFFSEMCARVGERVDRPSDLPRARRKVRAAFSDVLGFLRDLPTVVDAGRFLMVHGGVPTDNPELLKGMDAHALVKNDDFVNKGYRFDRPVIVGHWPVVNYDAQAPNANPHIFLKQNIISIDGGCGTKRDGQLNALIYPQRDAPEPLFAYVDDLPARVALDAQSPSRDAINIRWGDTRIEWLSEEAGVARVRHLSSGRVLNVPANYVYARGGEAHVGGITDCELGVKPGDNLSVVMGTKFGWYVKKEGRIGWYHGRLA